MARCKAPWTPPPRKRGEYFVRFGTWRPNEVSHCYAAGYCEAGVSCYDAIWDARACRWDVQLPPMGGPGDEDVPESNAAPEETFYALVAQHERAPTPVFVVTGEVVGSGYDNEPLLKKLRILHQVPLAALMASSLRWRG